MSYGLDIAEGDRAEILLALWDDTLYGIGKVYQNLYNPDFWSAASDKFTGVGPQVIVLDRDTDGKLYMLLASYGLTTQSVKYMYHDGSAWSTAVDLFSFDNNILEALDIAPVSNNTSHITWGEASLGTFYVFGSSLGWSEPMPIDLLADRGHAQDQQATAFNTYYYGCQMKADSDSGIHMVFSNSEGVFYKRFVPPEHVTKRYYAGGQMLATRVDGTLYYALNDPTGTSFTVTDDTGGFVGRIVYDGYGAELVNTLPAVLGQTLPGAPDAATGLVHQGNGRYYDPALGRPLQPNPAGAPPTVPQALNRYAATALGQPGVFQAVSQSSLTNLSLAMGAIKSSSAEILARATWGDLGQTVRILRPPSKSVIHVTASNSFLKKASHIIQEQWTVTAHSGLGSADRKLYTATFDVALGATTEDGVLAAFRAKKLALPSGRWAIKVSITNGDEVYDTVRIARLRWINNTRLGLATDVLLSATFQWIEDSYNPHFTIGQRIGRTTIAGAGSLGSSLVGLGVGSLACGPAAGVCFTGVVVTVGTTFAVNAFWSYVLQPLIFQNAEGLQPPPRDLQPLSVN